MPLFRGNWLVNLAKEHFFTIRTHLCVTRIFVLHSLLCSILLASLIASCAIAAEPAPAKPEPVITPGQAIVPPKMRRIWGELLSIDLRARTGTFRDQGNDEIRSFEVMPYAELLHHATYGDLQDFLIGERAIFRLHEDEKGVWRHLTYIQDEMNFLKNHGEWYWIDAIDRAANAFTCHQANADQSFVREKEVMVHFDDKTQFWKAGQRIMLDQIKVGNRMQIKAHGTGKGKTRVAWHIFLDTESVEKFQAEQKLVHGQRLREEGLPGYVDSIANGQIQLTLFQEGREWISKLKVGTVGMIAIAGTDRKALPPFTEVVVESVKMQGVLGKVTVKATQSLPSGIAPKGVVRVLIPQLFESLK